MKNIVLSAGGTGGHISPGVALIESILKNQEKLKIRKIYLHSPIRNRNNEDIKSAKVEVLWHNTPQPNLKSSFLFLASCIKTIFLFKGLKVDTVIGMGGYSSFPAILYAILFRKNLFLCEQNRVMGKTIRFFSKFAKKISLSFPLTHSIKCPNYKILGNPIREKIVKAAFAHSQNRTKAAKTKILVLGGSQGARQINEVIAKIYQLEFIVQNFEFLLITGENLFEETKLKIEKTDNIELIKYTNDIQKEYLKADFVIARAGAGLISECLLFELPMILFPYPYAADNHQSANAQYILENKAGFVIEQKNSDTNQLLDILQKIVENKNLLSQYSQNCKVLSKADAGEKIIDYFLK